MASFMNLFSKAKSLGNTRYVNRFVAVKPKYDAGRSNTQNEQEEELISAIKMTVNNFENMVNKYPIIGELKEVLYVVIKDFNDFKFTVDIANGKGSVSVGWDLSKEPSFVLPLLSQNIKNLLKVSQDGVIDMNEVYRIIRGLFIPFLKGLYQKDYSHLPKDKAYLELDNFLQVEVVNENNIEVEGFAGNAQATVVNVDGQWLIFEGFQGDPDIKFSMTVMDALKFAYLIRIKIMQAEKVGFDLASVVKEYNELKKKVTVYERSWHSVEELS